MGENVKDLTKNVFADIQAELLDLRYSSKSELSAIQGSLTLIITEAMAKLPELLLNNAPIPIMTENSSSGEISDIVMKKLAQLEKKIQLQDVTITTLTKSLSTDKGLQDKFDALSSKIRDMERTVEKQSKIMANDSKILQSLSSKVDRLESTIATLDGKLNHLAVTMGRRLSMFQSVEPEDHRAAIESMVQSINQNSKPFQNGSTSDVEDDSSLEHEISPLNKVEDSLKRIESLPMTRATIIKREVLQQHLKKVERISRPSSPTLAITNDATPITLTHTSVQQGDHTHIHQHQDHVHQGAVHHHYAAADPIKEKHIHHYHSSAGPPNEKPAPVAKNEANGGLRRDQMQLLALDSFENDALDSNSIGNESLTIMPDNHDDIVIEVILKKLERIESAVYDQVMVRLDDSQESFSAYTKKIQSHEEHIRELELVVQNLKNMVASSDAFTSDPRISSLESLKDMEFNNIVNDTKEHWEGVLTNINGRVKDMEDISKLLKKDPPEEHMALVLFQNELQAVLHKLNNYLGEKKESILNEMNSTFENLMAKAYNLAAVEEDARHREMLKPDYDGTLPPTKDLLLSAMKQTDALLNEKIKKIDLKKRIDDLEVLLGEKSTKKEHDLLEEEIKDILSMKADDKAITSFINKKASNLELQKLREMLSDEIESVRSMVILSNKNQSNASNQDNSGEINDLQRRFEMLYRQFQDVLKKLSYFVPREEVEQALLTLLDEVGAIKNSTVDKIAFNEKLKKKADTYDVEKLLKILQGTVGNPSGGSAAMHAKCLVCDKPVNPFGISSHPESAEKGAIAYDKAYDTDNSETIIGLIRPSTGGGGGHSSPNARNRGRTPGARPTTVENKRNGVLLSKTESNIPYDNKVRISTEINILRNSLDTLPAIPNAVSFFLPYLKIT